MAASRSGSTSEQLRSDIDSGRTGSKVAWPDPAAAPLGSDDEAAGTPPSREAVARARAEELSGPAAAPQRQAGLGHAWILVGAIVVIALVLILWAVFRH